jgi:hypothetical protein
MNFLINSSVSFPFPSFLLLHHTDQWNNLCPNVTMACLTLEGIVDLDETLLPAQQSSLVNQENKKSEVQRQTR